LALWVLYASFLTLNILGANNTMPVRLIFTGKTYKENESITDCQDYFQINKDANCFAIADGASQSFYPSIWAKLLVDNFCQNPDIDRENWKDWLKPIQEKWLLDIEERVEKAKAENKPTWVESYNGLNARRSATSTFIGLQFTKDRVKVSIIGDSCLFILNKKQLEKAYLLESSIDFNDRPEYLASYDKDNHFEPKVFYRDLQDDIYLILATDALSEYIFKGEEHKESIFPAILNISEEQHFQDFVESARNRDSIKMKNDDVALIVLCNESTSQFAEEPIEEQGQADSIYTSTSKKTSVIQESENRSDSNALISEERSPQESKLKNDLNKLSREVRTLKLQRFILGSIVGCLSIFLIINMNNSQESNQNISPTRTNPTASISHSAKDASEAKSE
jgi:serine/threonine protein phosphatase PrpC